MNYVAKFIKGMTVEELRNEIKQMYDDDYNRGCGIDRPRLWDINYTINLLNNGGRI